ALFEQSLAEFRRAGALLVDPVLSGIDLPQAQALANAPSYERADAINKYLAALPPTAPIRSVEEMIAKGGALVKPAIVDASKIGSLDHYKPLMSAMKEQTVL